MLTATRASEGGTFGAELGPEIFRYGLKGDLSLPKAIASIAERDCLCVNKSRSTILGKLCPIQWMLQRSRGHRLTFDQALELEDMLQGFCGNGEPLDPIMKQTILILQTTNPTIAQFVAEWMSIDA